ncbi:hypothetical protein PFISCL1PPCAC_15336, partial [Pristionchus fissidentatus]
RMPGVSRMSTTTSSLYEFEKQYSLQTAEVTTKIGQLSSLDSSQRVSAIQAIQKLLLDVGDLLGQMELAVRDLPQDSADRNKYELRVRSYRSDKKQLDDELAKAVNRLREAADRDELLALDESISMDQQEEQLIANTERLERTSRKLHDAYRIAIETEQIGTEVLGNLGAQRETINRSRNRMREADSDLGRSSKLLNEMIRRVVRNRLLLMGVATFLVLSFFFILYRSI